jgi:UDP-N-acetylglucosamine--N-acetylmuramyl-(pentapeptide) pyrophosphoryl-undecaprenol N-acetylglucosamine transferase
MAAEGAAPLVVLAAGGTGGHLFPAESLATELRKRGLVVDLATDERAARYGMTFPARATHIIPSATFRSRNPVSMAKTVARLGFGTGVAIRLLRHLRPAAVVGFGGYPSIPPLLAAAVLRIPSIIHEQNGVMGRANRLLARAATAIATSFAAVLDDAPPLARKATFTGNPVRPRVADAATIAFPRLEADGPLSLVVFGGSQGARIMSEIVPPAVERLERTIRARLQIVQQAREEDLASVRNTYVQLGVVAEVAPFFPDLPARIASAHLVVSRGGASTIAELAVIGRPAILVPLPHALDQDQAANARVLERAGGAIVLRQDQFTPERLAAELAALSGDPQRLTRMAEAARSAGAPDAAERLADLVFQVAHLQASRPNPA